MRKKSLIEGYKIYKEKNLNQRQKKLKIVVYITPPMDLYPRNGQMGDTDRCYDISC